MSQNLFNEVHSSQPYTAGSAVGLTNILDLAIKNVKTAVGHTRKFSVAYIGISLEAN
jgi:hypothetical protein